MKRNNDGASIEGCIAEQAGSRSLTSEGIKRKRVIEPDLLRALGIIMIANWPLNLLSCIATTHGLLHYDR